jgi:uncharacterized protein YmfQ (DUF2313 family)
MSRTARDVQAEMLQVQPPGWTLPDDPNTYWGARLLGWASEASRIEGSIEALLPQVDLRVAYDLLPDYQRVLGPDPCGRDLGALSFDDQASIAFQRWTAGGTMCAGALIGIAKSVGVTATITEVTGCICGAATCDSEMVAEGGSFMFIVNLPATGVTNCECGPATCDDSLGLVEPSNAQCPIEHAAPLHTLPIFNTSGH